MCNTFYVVKAVTLNRATAFNDNPKRAELCNVLGSLR